MRVLLAGRIMTMDDGPRDQQHRIRNTLQLVSSLVTLQAREVEHSETRLVLAVLEAQIHTLMVAHRWTIEADGQCVDLGGMIGDLCAMLETGLVLPDGPLLRIRCTIPTILVAPEHTMPLAFLVTALVAAAARADVRASLSVQVTAMETDGACAITLASSGLAGGNLPAIDGDQGLVAAMVRQLQASLVRDAATGRCLICFAVSAP